MNYQDFQNLKPSFSSDNNVPVQVRPSYNTEDLEQMKSLIKKNREIKEEWENNQRNPNGSAI